MNERTIMWAIQGRWYNRRPFLYTGTYLTRKDAIEASENRSGRSWDELRKRGDRAVKVVMEWEPR